MFQLPNIYPLTQYFVIMLANDKKYPDVYKKGQRLLKGKNIPSDWVIHFLKSDGTEMEDLLLSKRFEFSEIKEKMALAVKKVGKGITQSKYNKVRDQYIGCAVNFEIRLLKQAKKDFEKFVKDTKIKCYLVEDAKEKLKLIESMAAEHIDKAKKSIADEDFDSGFETLYELELWYNGLPQQKEVKAAIKELTKKHKSSKDAKNAIKLAKENVDALKLYQKAQGYFLKGKDAKGLKAMRKIQNKYPESKYGTMQESLIEVELPLSPPKPAEEAPKTGEPDGGKG